MKIIGKIGRKHGKNGVVKLIPYPGMNEIFNKISSAFIIINNGEKYEISDIRQYTRGRFIGKVNGLGNKIEIEEIRGKSLVIF
jgi:ribosomal 30S subunit maturation factor RimM